MRKFKRALKRIFCAKERKRIALERKVYNALVNHDVDAMIDMIKNGLDVNMEIRKSDVTDSHYSRTIWCPMDILKDNPDELMKELLLGVGAKTQAELREQKMARRKEEAELRDKQKEAQVKKEEERKKMRVKQFLDEIKDPLE